MSTQIRPTRSQPRALSLLLVIALLVAALPLPVQAASAANTQCNSYYTVKAGDSLYRIASIHKVGWEKIAAANDIIATYTIYVGQTLCIPKDKAGDLRGAPTAQAASFSVLRNGDSLVIRASNFPTKSFYLVKVDDFKASGVKWYRLGTLRTRSRTNVEISFELPKDLRKAYYFYVCLKNTVTDEVTCKAVIAVK